MNIHISRKGWIVIPAALRKKYGLKPGDEVRVVDYGGGLIYRAGCVRPDSGRSGTVAQ